MPLPTGDAQETLAAALPVSGRILSNEDLQGEVAKMIEAIMTSATAIANAGTTDSQQLLQELRLRLTAVEEALTTR